MSSSVVTLVSATIVAMYPRAWTRDTLIPSPSPKSKSEYDSFFCIRLRFWENSVASYPIPYEESSIESTLLKTLNFPPNCYDELESPTVSSKKIPYLLWFQIHKRKLRLYPRNPTSGKVTFQIHGPYFCIIISMPLYIAFYPYLFSFLPNLFSLEFMLFPSLWIPSSQDCSMYPSPLNFDRMPFFIMSAEDLGEEARGDLGYVFAYPLCLSQEGEKTIYFVQVGVSLHFRCCLDLINLFRYFWVLSTQITIRIDSLNTH